MSFNLTKSAETKNTIKTPLDLKMDEFDKMMYNMRKEHTDRISAIKKKMIELSKEQDRCEAYLEKLNQIH